MTSASTVIETSLHTHTNSSSIFFGIVTVDEGMHACDMYFPVSFIHIFSKRVNLGQASERQGSGLSDEAVKLSSSKEGLIENNEELRGVCVCVL